MQIEYSSTLSANEREHLINEVLLYDRAAVGAGIPSVVDFSARSGETLVGGVCGRLEGRRLYVEYLWVDRPFRGRGIGSQLLQMVESAAALSGCEESRIEALSMTTARLYLTHGYRLIHQIPDYIPGLPLLVMTKVLEQAAN